MNVRVLSVMGGIIVAAAAVAAGCGGEDDGSAPAATPPGDLTTAAAGESASPAGSLSGDMLDTPVPPQDPDGPAARSAQSGGSGQPKVVYLFYADGEHAPGGSPDACAGKGVPPKFTCRFAPTLLQCQQQIQSYLDRWYADLNVVFTLTRPTSGKYYTEVVSSGGGAWCGVDSRVAGVSPFQCRDIQGGVAYTFIGGNAAKETAIVIAQEQAHLVGLEHTVSQRDVMHPTICTDCDGFLDQETQVDGDRCDRATQTSHQMMQERLGAWPGGPKPSPFGCMTDEETPYVKIMSPADGATVSSDFTVQVDARDDCQLASVKVSVSPQGLAAESEAPPYQWDLTNLSGHQTITVTVADGAGHTSSSTVTVDAPSPGTRMASASSTAGCAVASGTFSVAGLLPSLAMLLLFPRRRRHGARPARRRRVTGELAGADPAPAAPREEAPEPSAVAGAAAQVPLGG